MEVALKVGINIEKNNTYDMGINIPAGDFDKNNPFVFAVSNRYTDANGNENIDPVLCFAYGDTKNIYLAIKPPDKLLEEAKINEYIDKLSVLVKEGNFDVNDQKFIEDTSNSQTE